MSGSWWNTSESQAQSIVVRNGGLVANMYGVPASQGVDKVQARAQERNLANVDALAIKYAQDMSTQQQSLASRAMSGRSRSNSYSSDIGSIRAEKYNLTKDNPIIMAPVRIAGDIVGLFRDDGINFATGEVARLNKPYAGLTLAVEAIATFSPLAELRGIMGASKVTTGVGGMSEIVSQRAQLRMVDTSDLTSIAKGDLAEARASLAYQRAGLSQLDSKLLSNNGFDGVFVRFDDIGNPTKIIINESKFSSSGYATLSDTTNMGKQLSEPWINGNINKMLRSDDVSVRATGQLLKANRDLIEIRTNLLTPDGINRGSRIKLPNGEYK